MNNMLYVTYVKDGRLVGDYVELGDLEPNELVEALSADDGVMGVYESCTNCGPMFPLWERE